MQRYESYKPSAIPWIDELPRHWGEEKGKWLHRFRKDLNNRKQCDNVLSLTLRGVVNNDPDDPEGLVPKDYGTYQIFEKDDLVFKLIDLENFRTSRVGLVHERGIMSPAYLRVQPGKWHNPRYFYYYYFTLYQQGIYNKLGAGVRSTLGPTDLLEIGVPVPSKDEQDRIVSFLDQKTAEIDAAITKKERLIELLQEQKKTIRNQVITKGLKRSALHCDSGVPWIGAIPSHWKVCAIKRLFKSMDYGLSESALGDGDFKYLNMGHIKDGKVSTENTGYLASAPDALLLRKNDILFNRTNSFDLVGKSGIFLSDEEKVTFASYMVRIRVKDEICPGWANSLMNSESYLAFIRTLALRSLNQANLNPTRLGAVSVPVPPKEEQEAIASYLDEMSTQVDISIRSTQKELCGLFEMKQATIANVVTGKIKV